MTNHEQHFGPDYFLRKCSRKVQRCLTCPELLTNTHTYLLEVSSPEVRELKVMTGLRLRNTSCDHKQVGPLPLIIYTSSEMNK